MLERCVTFCTPHAHPSRLRVRLCVYMCAQGVWTFGFRKWCFIAGLTLALKSKSILNITIRRPVQTHTVIHTRKSVCVRGAHGSGKKRGGRIGWGVELKSVDRGKRKGGEGETGAKKGKVKPHRMCAYPLPPLISSPTLSHPTSQPPDLPPDSIQRTTDSWFSQMSTHQMLSLRASCRFQVRAVVLLRGSGKLHSTYARVVVSLNRVV